ncbi:hypothetical protein [Endozoicomonas numazuensis]|uniref:Uncharacterized protein n=1 Tax=Endozoicomonas numazuensis TaxID=1137799 RepID=A0A081NL38_9GAMM|nr:hypothetical protein [Endozoicomonas numazuensis]KEQ19161.1 hypothetical protein GZ78_03960 [Endozoicomonas numazuensis]
MFRQKPLHNERARTPPPPPKQSSENAEKVVTRLVNEMALVLSRLENFIRERSILFLLVFDLGDTLFQ